MLAKIYTFLIQLKGIGKLFLALFTVIKWITPQGMHLLLQILKVKDGAAIQVENVAISDESDHGFKATLTLNVESKNKEALTTVKTEISNSPQNLIKD